MCFSLKAVKPDTRRLIENNHLSICGERELMMVPISKYVKKLGLNRLFSVFSSSMLCTLAVTLFLFLLTSKGLFKDDLYTGPEKRSLASVRS